MFLWGDILNLFSDLTLILCKVSLYYIKKKIKKKQEFFI